MILLLLCLFAFLLDLLILNLFAKLPLSVCLPISLIRVFISALYYPFLFPLSDQSLYYWPTVLASCSSSIESGFMLFAHLIHCSLGINSLQLANLFYGCLGTTFLSIAISTYRSYSGVQIISRAGSPWHFNLIVLFFCLDPSSIIYTSAFGKDLFTYMFILFVFPVLFCFNNTSLLIKFLTVLLALILFNDRIYVFLFLGLSIIAGLSVKQFKLKSSPPFVGFALSLTGNRYSLRALFLSLVLGIIASVFFFAAYDSMTSSSSFDQLFEQYSSEMGGNLAVPSATPIFLRPILFVLMPLPFLPPAIGSILLGVSTLMTAVAIWKIHSLRLYAFRSPWLNSAFFLSLLVSLMFGLSLTNYGIGARYRAQYIMPALFSVMLVSRRVANCDGANFLDMTVLEGQCSRGNL